MLIHQNMVFVFGYGPAMKTSTNSSIQGALCIYLRCFVSRFEIITTKIDGTPVYIGSMMEWFFFSCMRFSRMTSILVCILLQFVGFSFREFDWHMPAETERTIGGGFDWRTVYNNAGALVSFFLLLLFFLLKSYF